MVIAVDFDGTIVEMNRPYEDVRSALDFKPGARDALFALKRAGHTLILWSARANLSHRKDPDLDPLVRAGKRPRLAGEKLERSLALNESRYQQMLAFVEQELPDVFDAIDDGAVGKISADLYIDDRCLRFGRLDGGYDWEEFAHAYGEPAPFSLEARVGRPPR